MNYNARIWEVIKDKVVAVIREEIAKALEPSAQSEDGGETTEG